MSDLSKLLLMELHPFFTMDKKPQKRIMLWEEKSDESKVVYNELAKKKLVKMKHKKDITEIIITKKGMRTIDNAMGKHS